MKTIESKDIQETHALFPSGDWEGFYTCAFGPSASKHSMHFHLDFKSNMITGSGSDDVGQFNWKGQYDKENLRCKMTKHYVGHHVWYDGHVDENGIWGTWTISGYSKGGFHIWPKAGLENAVKEEKETAPEVRKNPEMPM